MSVGKLLFVACVFMTGLSVGAVSKRVQGVYAWGFSKWAAFKAERAK